MRVDSGKFASVGVLLLISTLAVNGAASKDSVIVKDVSFNSNGESLEVKITASDETKYTHFVLDHPRRLVVDFHGIQNTISFKEKKIDAAGVQRVRTSFFSDETRRATRIVFDLAGHPCAADAAATAVHHANSDAAIFWRNHLARSEGLRRQRLFQTDFRDQRPQRCTGPERRGYSDVEVDGCTLGSGPRRRFEELQLWSAAPG